MATTHAWTNLMWAEMEDLGRLLDEMPDEEFDRPSLCAGWAVRDVVGHMLVGHTTPMPRMLAMVARYRFNVTRASFEKSKELAGSLSPVEIRARWNDVVTNQTRRGIARLIPSNEAFVDHTVHHQDIRRAVERPRAIPEDRLVAALDGAAAVSSPLFSPRKKISGLRFEATDVGWSHGDGPVVTGRGEAILMSAAGRVSALRELDGEGVRILAERVGG